MDSPIDQLVARAIQRDPGAIAALLAEYLPGLRAFVRLRAGKLLREKESCSDLVQSVCREVLEHIDRFQYAGENAFRNWLYKTALRKLGHRYDYYQADKRSPAHEEPLPAARADQSHDPDRLLSCYATFCTPSRQAGAREELQHIEAAFDELSADHREVIVLSRILGLPHAEVAREMGRTEVAVRSLLSRALVQLAEVLVRRRKQS